MDLVCLGTQIHIDPKKKTYFYSIEKYIEDVKQVEKHVLDLPESIMKGSGLVKEKLHGFCLKRCK